MNRRDRERALLEGIRERPIGTQAGLAAELRRRGVAVTQATVSRDIKRMGLVKVSDPSGGYRYAAPGEQGPPPATAERLRSVFRDSVTGLAIGEAVLLVQTQVGRANTVAVAMDQARIAGIAGTVAGDDTILVVVRRASERAKVLAKLRALLP